MWDPSHVSAQGERQAKIRSCLDLATVLTTVPQAYRGILSDLFAKYTDRVEQRDQLARAKSKLEKLRSKGELPFNYSSLRLPVVQHQKGQRQLWNEHWSMPAEALVKKLKQDLTAVELNLINAQLVDMDTALDQKAAIVGAMGALNEAWERRPKHTMFKLVYPDSTDNWFPAESNLQVSTLDLHKQELQALQVDLPAYFAKVLDLKLDLIERVHGKKKVIAEKKRDLDTEMKDLASEGSKETKDAINKEVQRQVAAALKGFGVDPGSSSSKKGKKVRKVYHQDPTHRSVPGVSAENGEANSEGEEEGEKGQKFFSTNQQGGSPREGQGPSSPSWRRIRSQQEWAIRKGKREAEAAVEVLKSKPWTFGVPSSYPDELLAIPFDDQVSVLLSRAPMSLLDANRFRSPIHVQPGLNVPIQIQHDLSASLKFMFETKVDRQLIESAYTDLVRRIRWKWHFIDKVGDQYDPDYDVTEKLLTPEAKAKRKVPPPAHLLIERGLRAGQEYVTNVIGSIPDSDNSVRTPCPINLKRAREFVVSNNLIVTSTDKNLGVAVFKREWIYDQAVKLFGDTDNYTELTKQEAVSYLAEMATYIRQLCDIHVEEADPQMSTYLSHCLPASGLETNWSDWKDFVPEAYAIPKIHKNPWKGRPICPGHSLPQNAASKVLSKLARPYIDNLPWVIQGSKDFVRKLMDVKIPAGRKAFIVSADVVAFYPSVNLDILRDEILAKFAQETLIPNEIIDGMSTEQNKERRADYFNRLFKIAVAGPIMTFNGKILYQHGGLPMGAAGSPDAANLFAAWYELEWMERLDSNPNILFYGRYLDDIYCIVLADTPDEALDMLSFITLGDVKLLWEPPSDKANFLDLSTWIDGDKISHEPFVKLMSHRERIPWSSAHPLDVKKGTFSSEISRLATLCSQYTTYTEQCQEAVNLYIGRGYPPTLVQTWLKSQKEKRWADRLATRNTEAEETAGTFFTLKTHFNEAWKSFNVGELQTRITSHWQGLANSEGVTRRKRPRTEVSVPSGQRKRVRIALQGQQWAGQSRLNLIPEDPAFRETGVRLGGVISDSSLGMQAHVEQKAAQEWINTGKFLVSRKKNTQLWDLTRTWNKSVWDTWLERTGAKRPFDPTYEGLILPNQDDE